MEGVVILVILLAVIIVMPKGDNKVKNSTSGTSTNNSGGSQNIISPTSADAVNITLGTGNASYSYQSYEEYITIDNKGKNPVNITGWYLKNGKDKRAYDTGGQLKYYTADTAKIGQGVLFISPSGKNVFQNITLGQYERAIVTTGSMGSQSPYKIVSFKENICSGYLGNLDEYTFSPPLTANCPRPANEAGLSSLDTECRKFIERLPSCRTPEFDTKDSQGEICRNCVNGKPLSSACVLFIKSHFSYPGCIANHVNDKNFSLKTWRVFLNHGWEMWAKEFETIELFDQFNRLVKSRTY